MRNYHFFAGITIVFWAVAFILTRLSLSHFSPGSLGFLRYALASLALLAYACAMRFPMPRKRDAPWFMAAGAAGFFLYMLVFNTGQGLVKAATGSLIIATAPVFTAIIASWMQGEKLQWLQWLAMGIEFAGITILTGMRVGGEIEGVFLLLIAAVLLSAYNILQRRLIKSYSASQTAIYSMVCGTAMLGIYFPESLAEIGTANERQLLYLATLGFGSSAIAYLAWTKALSLAPKTAYVSNYMFLTPFLATLCGYILGGEVPDAGTIAGGSVIIFGALVFNFATVRS